MLDRSLLLFTAAILAACDRAPQTDNSAPDQAPPAAAAAPEMPNIGRNAVPAGAAVYFVMPRDGERVRNPVHVAFGLKGFGVVPAGIEHADAGHHHLLIDTEVPSFTTPIPADDSHRHFGLGQTETELTLPVGEHRLQLLVGDHLHVPHDPPLLSEPITIQVTE